MKIRLDEGARTPARAHPTDAGLDLFALGGKTIKPHDSAVFRTGVHVELPPGCAGLLVSKSGLNIISQITSTGLIDEGYTGEILVRLYNHGDEEAIIPNGTKISQLVVIPVRYEPVEITDEIKGGERGNAGFGSTGA